MDADFPVELINATVQIEQDLGNNTKTVGTAFLVSAPTPDGRPRTVLVTAGHLFERMPRPEVRIGWRLGSSVGDWRYAPGPLTIRTPGPSPVDANASASPAATPMISASEGRPIWVRHPTQDIAAIAIQAPSEFAKAAVPLAWLADDRTFTRYGVRPGDEMMALGFPRGLSSNRAGFPILRWGRVASYPLSPVQSFPTFLMDFRVFDGNSGGPVFMADPDRGRGAGAAAKGGPGVYFIAGVLTKQVESRGDRLEIGVVVHARHVREAIAMLDRPGPRTAAPARPATPVGTQSDKAGG
ncbi:MAG: serine protease [Proteobacteria bacterium]|nr:serine protease [Pseudomonadota bacterium]